MFSQKPPSLLTKYGETAMVLLFTLMFLGGGLLLSRHVSLALPFLFLALMFALPALAVRLFITTPKCSQEAPAELPLLANNPAVEWTQIIGKDGEVVEVGYIKKQRPDIG
ncbi:MAG: hypothetical protein U0694_18245 [Anaerolineae bacterium]